MLVRFWGTRGSIPTPGQATAKYGGNTSCVELRTDDGTLLVLDCGTGARELGLSLQRERPVRAHLLITHTHWDHIQGFPFFTPAFLPDSEITVYAPTGFAMSLGHALSDQMQYSYFPVQLEDLTSRLHLVDVEEGTFQIGPITVRTQYLNHTAPTIGYRITVGGTTAVYATDHEPFAMDSRRLIHPGDERHAAFLDRADLLIHDSQYASEEYSTKLGWGHSPTTYSVNVALEAGVRRLALSHHDPTHNDEAVQGLEAASQAQAAARPAGPEVFAAAEGMEVYLPERPGQVLPLSGRSSFDRRPVAGAKVLLVSDVPGHIESITRVFEQEGMEALVASQEEHARRLTHRARPQAVVLDGSGLGERAYPLAATLRADLPSSAYAMILLAPSLDEQTMQKAYAAGITDCLAVPFSAPMLYSRLRSWLTRYDRVDRPRIAVASPVPPPASAAPRHSGAERKADILASSALFAAMDRQELVTLGRKTRHRVFAPGQVIVEQGLGGGTLYVIVAGRVRVVARPVLGQTDEVLLDELGAGDFFGELSSLDDLSYSATVRAVTRVRCLAIPRGDFLAIVERNPAFNLRLLLSLSHRLRQADRLLLGGGSGYFDVLARPSDGGAALQAGGYHRTAKRSAPRSAAGRCERAQSHKRDPRPQRGR